MVFLGLCPVALGTDGGGSVRIPAAVCGIVGIKGMYVQPLAFHSSSVVYFS